MATVTATPKAVVESHYGRFSWVEDYQVRFSNGFFADVTLFLSDDRPADWMDALDAECASVFSKTRFRTIFACFDSSGARDLLR
jgi:hypothetical protein